MARESTGLSSYIAKCVLMAHGLAVLGSIVRAAKTPFSHLKNKCREVVDLKPGENFSPLQLWSADAQSAARDTMAQLCDDEAARAECSKLVDAYRTGTVGAD